MKQKIEDILANSGALNWRARTMDIDDFTMCVQKLKYFGDSCNYSHALIINIHVTDYYTLSTQKESTLLSHIDCLRLIYCACIMFSFI